MNREESDLLMAENERLKRALHDDDVQWKQRIETKVDGICNICGSCGTTIKDLKTTVYGNGNPGLKTDVKDLQDIVLGRDAKDSGLSGKVERLSRVYQTARGGWKLLALEASILVTLATIAIGIWQAKASSAPTDKVQVQPTLDVKKDK